MGWTSDKTKQRQKANQAEHQYVMFGAVMASISTRKNKRKKKPEVVVASNMGQR